MKVIVTFTHGMPTYKSVWEGYYKPFGDLKYIDAEGALRQDWGATYHTMNNIQAELFKTYDTIVFVDMDEIIVPNPEKYKDLGEYLDKCKSTRCIGYNVIEMGGDKPLDLTKPILTQRAYWSRDWMYDKCVIIKEPHTYTSNHAVKDAVNKDSDLVMLHLRDADITSAKQRCKYMGREFDVQAFVDRRDKAELIPKKYLINT